MPYTCEIPKEHDRRIKLTDEQKEEIRRNYGKISQRKLAAAFGVPRRLIQFIGDPDKKKRDLELRAARGGSNIYYDRKKHNLAMKKHRQHKQKLFLKGKL